MPYIQVQEPPYLSQIALLAEMSRNVSRHLKCLEMSQDIKADGELSCETHKTINVSVCFCDSSLDCTAHSPLCIRKVGCCVLMFVLINSPNIDC